MYHLGVNRKLRRQFQADSVEGMIGNLETPLGNLESQVLVKYRPGHTSTS